ncbi:hypothetical protein PHYPSEUDO_004577 [Phytophthora pseudosyringae]|uniref:Uncharacterized protein n=1 Tax=Phytophthora pseudosyringae TaxID=221518 RepID=A0A8T1WCT4_9STRA|nr:hypothetical protein PHYPSEUDO_004577 [Phytophthora pseudosyringae]
MSRVQCPNAFHGVKYTELYSHFMRKLCLKLAPLCCRWSTSRLELPQQIQTRRILLESTVSTVHDLLESLGHNWSRVPLAATGTTHFSTHIIDHRAPRPHAMKFLTPFLLALAITAVSAAEMATTAPSLSTSSSLSTSASASTSASDSASSSGSSVSSASASVGSSDTDSASAGSATDSGFSSASSNSTDTVQVGDSESGSSGSEDLAIQSDKWSGDNSGSSASGLGDAASAASGSRADTGSSSGAASIQTVTFYASATIAVALGALL